MKRNFSVGSLLGPVAGSHPAKLAERNKAFRLVLLLLVVGFLGTVYQIRGLAQTVCNSAFAWSPATTSTNTSGPATAPAIDTALNLGHSYSYFAQGTEVYAVRNVADGTGVAGSIKWTWQTPSAATIDNFPNPVKLSPTGVEVVFVTARDGFLYKIDAASGTTDSSVDTRRVDPNTSTVVCATDQLVASPVVQLYNFSNPAFQSDVAAAAGSHALNDDVVFVITFNQCGDHTHNRVIAYWASNLAVKWTFNANTDNTASSSPFAVDASDGCELNYGSNTLFCGTNLQNLGGTQDSLFAIDSITSQLHWAANAGSVKNRPLLSNGKLYVAASSMSGGMLQAYGLAADPNNAFRGLTLWNAPVTLSGAVNRNLWPVGNSVGNSLLVVDSTSTLTRIVDGGSAGTIFWQSAPPAGIQYTSAPVAVASLGKVYIGRSDGTIQQIEFATGQTELAVVVNPGAGVFDPSLDIEGGAPDFNRLVVVADAIPGSAGTGVVTRLVIPICDNSTVIANPTAVLSNGIATSTITVTLKDVSNNPVIGKTVTLAQESSGSSIISAASGPSDSNGVVTFTVKDGKAEKVSYTATNTTDLVTIAQQTAVFFFGPDPIKSTVVANPTTIISNGVSTSTITVTLKDANNNPVIGKTVTLAQASQGSSTISPASGPSDSNGVVTFTVKDLQAESARYAATDATDLITIGQQPAVTFLGPDPTNSTAIANPASVPADGISASTITVTLLDQFNKPVSGKTVTLAQHGAGSSTISPASGPADSNGVVTFTVKDMTVETVFYDATDATDSIILFGRQLAGVVFTATDAAKSTVSANPASVTANGASTSTVTVTLKDVNNKPVVGKTVTLGQGAGSSTISAASGPSDSNGVVTFTVKDAKPEVVTYTATDTADSVTIAQQAQVSFTAVAPDHLVLSPATATILVGGIQAFTATGYDKLNNSLGDVTSSTTLSIAPDGSCTGASCTANLAGTHTVTGTDGLATGTASLTISKASPNVNLTPSASNTLLAGQAQTFVATVGGTGTSGGSGIAQPTGNVTLFDGASNLMTVALGNNGQPNQASFSLTLAAGAHAFTAQYSGDSNYLAASSTPALQFVISKTGTSTGLVPANTNNLIAGQSQTFIAQIGPATTSSSGLPAPAGTVTFLDGSTVVAMIAVGTAQANAAILMTSTLAAGPHTLVAQYSGDDNYLPSSSAPLSFTISKTSTFINNLVPSSSNTLIAGQPQTFTATVQLGGGTGTGSGSSTPVPLTGTVTFFDGTTSLGGVPIGNAGPNTSSFTISTLAGGPHSLTAQYSGDANYLGSTSQALSFSITNPATTTGLSASPNPSTYGQSVTFNATVSSSAGTPTGNVTFYDGSTSLGQGTLSSGVATLTTTLLTAGTHSITASYPATGNFLASTSSAVTQTVNPAPLVVTVDNKTRQYGQANPPLTGTISGLQNADNITATYTTTATPASPVGTYPITDPLIDPNGRLPNYTVTVNNGTLTITPAPLTITANNQTKTYGQTVAFAGTEFTAGGLLNADKVNSVTLTSAGAAATASVAGSPYSIAPSAAVGSGLGNYNISYMNGTLTVTPAALTITADNKTKILNAPLPTFTAAYSGFVNGDGAASLTGVLSFTTNATASSPVGTYMITSSGQSSSNYSIGYKSGTLTIIYQPGGMCDGDFNHQILQPINADGTSVWKQGRTVPAKFRVCDTNGVSIGTPGVVASFYLSQIIAGTVTSVDETVSSTSADTAFRWDPSAQQWIFNISTANLLANQTYVYVIGLNDGSTITFQYGLR